MAVRFRFEGVDAPARQLFMRHFDLYMQRGGGEPLQVPEADSMRGATDPARRCDA